MKLKQRVVLGYYKNKFRLLSLLSHHTAAKSAFELFCTPYSRKKYEKPPALFLAAEDLTLRINKQTVRGYRFEPPESNGRSILICHGFDSNCYRFEDYVQPLVAKGFSVLAFDAPGHGRSSGKTITILQYGEMIEKINDTYGPLYGIMSHSFGGLAAVLIIEKVHMPSVKKLVMIAPSTETLHAVKHFFSLLKLIEPIQTSFLQLIKNMGGQPTEWYSVSRAVKNIKAEVLWVHDKRDSITPYNHMEHLLDQPLKHIQFKITDGLGHSPYREPEVIDRIVNFF